MAKLAADPTVAGKSLGFKCQNKELADLLKLPVLKLDEIKVNNDSMTRRRTKHTMTC